MAKFNVGDKVRILDVDSILFGKILFNNGDIAEVVAVNSDGDIYVANTDGRDLIILRDEFHAIEKVSDVALDYKSLEQRVSELEAKVAELISSGTRVYMDGKKIGTITAGTITQNQLRKEVIEKAKEFVVDTKMRAADPVIANYDGNELFNERVTESEFIVNEDKRTVVALVRYKTFAQGVVRSKGIAKCNPSDVFNEHIGKAIALGRAYGLDVSEFENAPQPDEVAVGMKVEVHGNRCPYVDTVTDEFEHYYHSLSNLIEYPSNLIRIISDSEAQY